jgi:broad specificity phosphatase PhoE
MITVLFVRHADVDVPPAAGSADPSLNAAGQARAEALAQVAGAAGIDTILTSSFTRTKQTVERLAASLGREPSEAAAPEDFAAEIASGADGEVVLVAGHSNTVPEMIAALGGPPVAIGHREFDNLFVVTLGGPNGAGFLHLKYGKPSA